MCCCCCPGIMKLSSATSVENSVTSLSLSSPSPSPSSSSYRYWNALTSMGGVLTSFTSSSSSIAATANTAAAYTNRSNNNNNNNSNIAPLSSTNKSNDVSPISCVQVRHHQQQYSTQHQPYNNANHHYSLMSYMLFNGFHMLIVLFSRINTVGLLTLDLGLRKTDFPPLPPDLCARIWLGKQLTNQANIVQSFIMEKSQARTRRKGNTGSRKINANKSATPSPTSPLTQSSASSLQTSTFKLVSSSTPAALASIYSIVTPSNVVVFSVAVASSSIASITTSMSPTSQTPPSSRTSLFDSCHRKIRLIGGGPVAFLGGLVA
ncbi:hypothetical protein GQX74_003607 [Glossina fuscipes]|nr:hypothetical protein GQX74_003607 [Glossina fuscipes]